MTSELFKRYRPKSFKYLVGQPEVVRSLEKFAAEKRMPHTILLTGPSGCGKTTIARIIKKILECGDMDFEEVNCAEARGIDEIRAIQQRMSLSPIQGKCRMWLLDETHRMTGDSMSACLKILEDTPSHVYFVLATTDPEKLLNTIRTRCTIYNLKPLSNVDLEKVLSTVLQYEKKTIAESVQERIIEASDGSARKALVLLHQVLGMDENEAVETILKQDTKRQSYELVKKLVFNPKTKWGEIASILKEIEDEPEKVRRQVLRLAAKIALDNGKGINQAYKVLDIFKYDLYNSGKPGLVAMCMEAFNVMKGMD